MKSFMKLWFVALVMIVTAQGAVCAQDVKEYSLRSQNGDLRMQVLDYGARIKTLSVRGVDVVLGFDDNNDYVERKQNFGAVVGRYIGRIVGGRLSIDGNDYQLKTGGNGDCSHGGTPGFANKWWTVTERNDSSIVMRYVSADGENGFPGELTLVTTYMLTDDALRIDYMATTTKPTVLNPSNHSFFNLSGKHEETILNEELWIDAGRFAAYDENKRVTGEMRDVSGTAFDFNVERRIGERIDEDDPQLKVTRGYDHCYELNTQGDITRPAARIKDSVSGLTMEVFTTEPAMQVYTANGHKGNMTGKGGKVYNSRNAICFETMHFPDSPNKPQWPSTVLRPGETFKSTTVYKWTRVSDGK